MQILLVDGNFFCYRLMHYEDLLFKDDLEKDRDKFFKICTQSLINEIENIPTKIDHIIMACDYDSWRKGVEMIFPKHYDEGLKVNYKYNREISEKLYDKEQLYIAMADWFKKLKEVFNIGFIRVQGAESDDIVSVLANRLTTNPKLKDNIHVICWTSDGDYPQMVNDNISVMKLPNKTLITNKVKRTNSAMSIFESKKENLIKRNTVGKYLNVVKNGVKEVHPTLILLEKIVCGDKKDNVPPTYMWDSTTGKVKYKPTLTHIEGVLVEMGLTPFDLTNELIFSDKFISEFMDKIYVTSGAYKDNPCFHPKLGKVLTEKMFSNETLTDKEVKKIEKIPAYNIGLFNTAGSHKKIAIVQGIELYKQNIILKALDVNVIPKRIVDAIDKEFKDNNKKIARMKPFYENSMTDIFKLMDLEMSDSKVYGSSFGHLK